MNSKLTENVSAWKVMDEKELVETLGLLAEEMENHKRVTDGIKWQSEPNDTTQIEQLFSEGAAEFFEELTERLSELEGRYCIVKLLRDDLRHFIAANEGTLEKIEHILAADDENETASPAVGQWETEGKGGGNRMEVPVVATPTTKTRRGRRRDGGYEYGGSISDQVR